MCSNWICAVMLLLTCLPISKCEDNANTSSEQSEEDMRMLQLVVYIALAVIVICAIILCSSVVYVWHLYQKRKKELPLHKSTMDVPMEVVHYKDEKRIDAALSPKSSLGPSAIIPAGSDLISVDGNSKVDPIDNQHSLEDEDDLSYGYSLEPPKTICTFNTDSF